MRRIPLALLLVALLATTGSAAPEEAVVTTKLPPMPGIAIAVAFPELEFDRPLWIGAPPDGSDRLYVVEQGGRILVFENDAEASEAELVLDLRPRVRRSHNEEGLLGLAFHPRLVENGFVYLYYSASEPRRVVLSRFTMDRSRTRIDASSEKVLLEVEQPWGNHNGGGLAFGPDGFLYVSLGDGGRAGDPLGSGQDVSTLLGSMLRLDVDGGDPYAIPEDNPWVGVEGARPEIYAWGLRNVWRFSFDRDTGELWAGDVGQNSWEEISLLTAGGNFGWNLREGFERFRGGEATTPLIEPVVVYGRRQARSITGGFVYRGEAVPRLSGAYVHGDFETGLVWALWREDGRISRHVALGRVEQLSSFGEDPRGELYLCSLKGRIYRIQARPNVPPSISGGQGR